MRRELGGAQVLLEIQLAASQLAQEQVVQQTRYTNISPQACSGQYEGHSQFSIYDFIAPNAEATELHADFLEARTKVIRKRNRLVSLEPVPMCCTTRSGMYGCHVLRDCLTKAADRFLGLRRR